MFQAEDRTVLAQHELTTASMCPGNRSVMLALLTASVAGQQSAGCRSWSPGQIAF
jgi:hypothetical protein